MTVESYWYASYVDGRPPPIRMIRPEVRDDPDAPRRLAIAFGAGDGYGDAGYRPVRNYWRRRHQIWFWHGSGMPGTWFYIPDRFIENMRDIRNVVQHHCHNTMGTTISVEQLIAALSNRALVERIMAAR